MLLLRVLLLLCLITAKDASGTAVTMASGAVEQRSDGESEGVLPMGLTDTVRGSDAHSVSLNAAGDRVAFGFFERPLESGAAVGHVFVYEKSGSKWVALGGVIECGKNGGWCGWDVSLNAAGDRLAVGSPIRNGGGNDAGHVDVLTYEVASSTWVQMGHRIEGCAAGDGSGYSVALNAAGDVVAIGSPYNNEGRGHVRVFKFGGTLWSQQGASISGMHAGNYGGFSVAMNAAGDRVAIGTPHSSHASAAVRNDAGSVRLYEFSEGAWKQVGSPLFGEGGSYCGYSVALDAMGKRVAAGAPFHMRRFGGTTGRVCVHATDGTIWSSMGDCIYSNDEHDVGAFGTSVSFNGDGDRLAIGLSQHDAGGGIVRTFRYSESSWVSVKMGIDGVETAKVTGGAVSMSAVGGVLAIGAPLAAAGSRNKALRLFDHSDASWRQHGQAIRTNKPYGNLCSNAAGDRVVVWAESRNGTGRDSDNVYVYELRGDSWEQLGNAIIGGTKASVAMSAKGDVVAVGTPYESKKEGKVGSVRVFQWVEAAAVGHAGSWEVLGEKIFGNQHGERFGFSVSLSDDGYVLAVGAPDSRGTANMDLVGQVRIYKLLDASGSRLWRQLGEDIDGDNIEGTSGRSVSLNAAGDRVAIGAPSAVVNGLGLGSVRVYSLDATGSTGSTYRWLPLGDRIYGTGTSALNEAQFGFAVALNDAGDRLAVGAPYARYDSRGGEGAGCVSILDSNGDNWSLIGSVIVGDVGDNFGFSVALNAAGDRVAAGAPSLESELLVGGRVRVYAYSDKKWVQMSADIAGAVNPGLYGWSVALSGSGGRVIAGGPTNDGFRVTLHTGFSQSIAGLPSSTLDSFTPSWVKKGGAIRGEAQRDGNGCSVSVNAAGDRIAIGAVQNSDSRLAAGHVRVFERRSGVWIQLGASIVGQAAGDQSGDRVSLNAAGDIVAISALGHNGKGGVDVDSGQVRVFFFNETVRDWVKLGDDIDGVSANDLAGSAVALNREGHRVAIGALGHQEHSGHVRVFDFKNSLWVQAGGDIRGPSPKARCGMSVAFDASGDRVAVAMPGIIDAGRYGQVLVYDLVAGEWRRESKPIRGPGMDNGFGHKISMNGEGDVVAVAAVGSVQVFQLKGKEWKQVGERISFEGDPSGNNVDLNARGDRLAVGSFNLVSGYVKVFALEGSEWQQMGDDVVGVADGDRTVNDIALNDEGDVVAVGVPRRESGHVQVYSWRDLLSGHRTFSNGSIAGIDVAEESGFSVSLSDDATRLAIGAPFGSPNDLGGAGYTSVFVRVGRLWKQLGGMINGTEASGYSGWSVSISAGGDRVAIGAIAVQGSAGEVRVFQFTHETLDWVQLGGVINGTAPNAGFGGSVSLSASGDCLAVASWNGKRVGDSMVSSVRVFALKRDDNDGAARKQPSWKWEPVGGDIEGAPHRLDSRGSHAVAVASGGPACEGAVVVVGSPFPNLDGAESVNVYSYSLGNARWLKTPVRDQVGLLGWLASWQPTTDALGGWSVAVNHDGTRLAFSDKPYDARDGMPLTGRVRVFEYGAEGALVQLGGDIMGVQAGGAFGSSVSLNAAGDVVAVGSDVLSPPSVGHVSVFRLLNGEWTQKGDVIDGLYEGERFGFSVSLDAAGNRVAVGAPSSGDNPGSARVFQFTTAVGSNEGAWVLSLGDEN